MQFSIPENKRWIINGLEREFSRVLSGEKERIKASLYEDDEYNSYIEPSCIPFNQTDPIPYNTTEYADMCIEYLVKKSRYYIARNFIYFR